MKDVIEEAAKSGEPYGLFIAVLLVIIAGLAGFVATIVYVNFKQFREREIANEKARKEFSEKILDELDGLKDGIYKVINDIRLEMVQLKGDVTHLHERVSLIDKKVNNDKN